jgi:signal transduction histidine kinase
MFIPIKIKIRSAVLIIILLFTFFTLFYFPRQEGNYLLKSYNSQVQNLANSVALGVEIALNEDNFQGVEKAMQYVKGKPDFLFVSLVQTDTIWNDTHKEFTLKQSVFKRFPDSAHTSAAINSNDSVIIKQASFNTPLMSGAVMLTFSTHEINANKKSIRITSLLVSACILLVGMLISFWLSKNISKPVEALSNAAQKVGKGDLTPVVTSFANDEIGKLTQVFNKMVTDLSAAQQALKNTNETLSATNNTLSYTLTDLKSAQAQLIQSEKMASLGELTAGIAHEIQNPLNFVNNFSEINQEMIDELQTELKSGNIDGAITILNDIKDNSQKINHHGNRADAIVKGMLQHSQKSTGKKEPTNINALCDEYLRLAYHGLKAKDKNFNVTMQTDFDSNIEKINIIPQEIGRVLLNLFNNAFYAASEKLKAENLKQNTSYKPTVSVETKKLNARPDDRGGRDKVEIKVSDNGSGIPQNIVDKIFQPFFTTKPTGQGTGLGLSLSYDTIKAHGGEIKVETKEGEGSEFVIVLPA